MTENIKEILEIISDILKNYDGIIGTILGMIVSFLLQNRGKLKIFIKKSYGEFYYKDNEGFPSVKAISSEIDYLVYKTELYLYNTSSDFKSIRDLKLNIFNEGTIIFTERLKDNSTTTYNNGFSSTREADVYNISPKNVRMLDLYCYISKEDLEKINCDNVLFEIEYTYCKNKIKKLELFKGRLEELQVEEA